MIKRAIQIHLLLAFFSQTVFAVSEKGVEKIAHDLKQAKTAVIDKEVKQRKILSSLFIINKKMHKIVTEKSGMERDRLMLESNTRDLAQKIMGIESKLKSQRLLLLQRLSAIYKFGGQGLTRFLFKSTSSADLERNLKILGIVAKRDVELITDYSDSMKELEGKKLKLSRRLANLKRVEGNIRLAEGQLKNETDTKSKILDNLKRSHQFELTKLASLRSQTEKMNIADDGLLDLLAGPAFFEQKGKLPFPIKGEVRQGFGLIQDSESNSVLSYKGIFFGAKKGTEVHSVFGGKVAFVGEIPGFGRTVIVDHGDHYYSVYAHAHEALVVDGEPVKQNQTVALAGSSSLDYGEGIYFEIRHFSEPYDPKNWMKGKAL